MVRPENRLVADSLEKHWNDMLAQLNRLEEEYARYCKVESPQLNAETRESILALASDLPRVWNDLEERMRDAGWLTTAEVAAQLGVHYQTAKTFAIRGVLKAMRVNDKDEILFEPIIGPLPKAQPGKRFKDRRRYQECASKRRNEVQYEA